MPSSGVSEDSYSALTYNKKIKYFKKWWNLIQFTFLLEQICCLIGCWVTVGSIKTTQLSWSLNWASPPREERGVKSGPLTHCSRTTTECSSPKSAPNVLTTSWYHQVPVSPCSCQKKNFHCPIPPAEKYFLLCLCISAAPFLLLSSISPFACALKPWALLNTVTPWCYSDWFHVVPALGVHLSLPPFGS